MTFMEGNGNSLCNRWSGRYVDALIPIITGHICLRFKSLLFHVPTHQFLNLCFELWLPTQCHSEAEEPNIKTWKECEKENELNTDLTEIVESLLLLIISSPSLNVIWIGREKHMGDVGGDRWWVWWEVGCCFLSVTLDQPPRAWTITIHHVHLIHVSHFPVIEKAAK